MTRTVWAIPLASRGFVAIDELTNPVRWYLEDYESGRIVDTKPHATKADAEAQAVRNGWTIHPGPVKQPDTSV